MRGCRTVGAGGSWCRCPVGGRRVLVVPAPASDAAAVYRQIACCPWWRGRVAELRLADRWCVPDRRTSRRYRLAVSHVHNIFHRLHAVGVSPGGCAAQSVSVARRSADGVDERPTAVGCYVLPSQVGRDAAGRGRRALGWGSGVGVALPSHRWRRARRRAPQANHPAHRHQHRRCVGAVRPRRRPAPAVNRRSVGCRPKKTSVVGDDACLPGDLTRREVSR